LRSSTNFRKEVGRRGFGIHACRRGGGTKLPSGGSVLAGPERRSENRAPSLEEGNRRPRTAKSKVHPFGIEGKRWALNIRKKGAEGLIRGAKRIGTALQKKEKTTSSWRRGKPLSEKERELFPAFSNFSEDDGLLFSSGFIFSGGGS